MSILNIYMSSYILFLFIGNAIEINVEHDGNDYNSIFFNFNSIYSSFWWIANL